MLDQEIKQHINNARNVLVGKVPDPKAQVEQITTAMIYKFMDDMDQQTEAIGGKPHYFVEELKEFSWRRLMSKELSGQERWELYTRALTAFSKSERIPPLFRTIFKDAFLPYRDAETLNLFLKEINFFTYEHSENLGNAYEYLLSVLGSQGDAGQFRTPRHIIDFIVEVVNPQKTDRILDPACGTAGFLISSYKHIWRQNSSNYKEDAYTPTFARLMANEVTAVEVQKNGHYRGDLLTPDDRKRLADNIIGYDISPDMVHLSLVNMYLHGFATPHIYEYDTLTYEERWDNTFDVILANPPFMTPKGGIRPHKRFQVQANRAEVLFVDYIAEHLTINGKAGIIVPEGIIFQSARAYKELRKNLVENWGLYAVVSLPAGVFQPYSGVKTSILLLDKALAKRSDEILFVKVENDGFDLGAQRRKIDQNDLPEAYRILKAWQRGEKTESPKALWVKKEKLAENGEYNLTGDRYRAAVDYSKVKWPMVKLGDLCEILDHIRKPVKKADRKSGTYPYYGATGIVDYVDKYLFDEKLVLVGEDGAKWASGEKTAFIATGKYWVNNHAHVLRPDRTKILDELLVELLNNMDLNPYITGITVPKLTQQKLKQIQIPLPPLEVQKEIVAELDSYQKVIDGARQVVDNWKPRIKIDPDWPRVKLGEVCEVISGFSFNSKDFSKDNPIKVIKITNVGVKKFIDEETGNLPKSYLNIYHKFIANTGDIVISLTRSIISQGLKVASVPKHWDNSLVNQRVAVLKEKGKIDKRFIFAYLSSENTYLYVKERAKSLMQPNLSINDLKRLPIPNPPLNIQKQIVAEIEKEQKIIKQLKELIKIHEQKIKDKIAEVWGEEK